ncbi:MAG: hypothetical protein JXA69_01915 [Phycisphaerae bacterium]|nr:hypothetical protein [Phycisphaerae bacterium]
MAATTAHAQEVDRVSGKSIARAEPNADIAAGWWPEFENVWTPIGWKDNPLRFNVIYDGTLMAAPVRWPARGQGVQLTFIPSSDGVPPRPTTTQPYQLRNRDGGVGDQGWNDGPVPVLWTRWRQDKITLRQEIFAHVPGGGAIQDSSEPLFAWVRLSVAEVAADDSPPQYGFLVRINQPHIRLNMDRNLNLLAQPQMAAYPHALRLEPLAQTPASDTYLLLDEAHNVRLAVAAKTNYRVHFIDERPDESDAYLHLSFPPTKDAYVDLLVPLVPAERDVAVTELNLGRDAALAEAGRFWAAVPETAARVDTPERLINEACRHSPKFAEVIAERHPETGRYSLLSGSWNYEMLWATPTSMNITMILDGLGYHSVADKYLEIFRQEQGTIVPPGGAYRQHPGYLATPRILTSIDWLSDHGAVLYAAARHALVSDDKEFIERWTDPILLACEFIRDFRASDAHDGVKGLLPAAVATDTGQREQAVWNDGWNYKGLATSVRLLQRIGHPRADEFAREARDYRETFVRAMREAMDHMPEWEGTDGRHHRFVPTALPGGGDVRHPFYLDTGPLFAVYAGLMDADDELMRSSLLYFREGPNTRSYDLAGPWHQPITLHHEQSSCEPCYSWNIFHAWQTADRMRFLEGLYSLLTGAVSRQTSIGCEHRGGISGTLFSLPLTIEAARLSVIDDQIEPDSLHLLRLVPLAWLTTDHETVFERLPTEYGPVTLRFRLADEGRRLDVSFTSRFRFAPARVRLHVPPLPALRAVTINGRPHEVKPGETMRVEIQ